MDFYTVTKKRLHFFNSRRTRMLSLKNVTLVEHNNISKFFLL